MTSSDRSNTPVKTYNNNNVITLPDKTRQSQSQGSGLPRRSSHSQSECNSNHTQCELSKNTRQQQQQGNGNGVEMTDSCLLPGGKEKSSAVKGIIPLETGTVRYCT